MVNIPNAVNGEIDSTGRPGVTSSPVIGVPVNKTRDSRQPLVESSKRNSKSDVGNANAAPGRTDARSDKAFALPEMKKRSPSRLPRQARNSKPKNLVRWQSVDHMMLLSSTGGFMGLKRKTQIKFESSGEIEQFRLMQYRTYSKPFFFISFFSWLMLSISWYWNISDQHISLQVLLYVLIICPCLAMFILSYAYPPLYDRIWDSVLCFIVVAAAIVVCCLTLTQESCTTVEDEQSWACYDATEPMIVNLYLFMPLFFGAGEYQTRIGNTLALIIQLCSLPFGDWAHGSSVLRISFITVVTYVCSIFGAFRNNFFRKIDEGYVEFQKKKANKLKAKLKNLDRIQERVFAGDGKGETAGTFSEVQQALTTALNEDVSKAVRERAWNVIYAWIGEDGAKRVKSQVVYARAETKTPAGFAGWDIKQLMEDQKDGSGYEKRVARQKMKMVAGISQIRSWMRKLNMKYPKRRHSLAMNASKRKVFLGGSCNPTTWRKDIAIPKLKQCHIPYYNPQVDEWTPDLVEIEAKEKETAGILFFVIDNKTNAVASMLEVVELATAGRQLVAVIQLIDENSQKAKELEPAVRKDLNRGRAYAFDTARRYGVPLFKNINDGLDEVVRLSRAAIFR
mmetsp:Transcript_16315/g.26480  ORF Transcript_16315/g.26480 Transcript_16315/m.26480 type:complete len:622 (-) Transcript_16315:169-2034(-)